MGQAGGGVLVSSVVWRRRFCDAELTGCGFGHVGLNIDSDTQICLNFQFMKKWTYYKYILYAWDIKGKCFHRENENL